MENKYFKVSYQGVKGVITFVLFVVIAIIVIGNYKELIVNFQIKDIVSVSEPNIVIIILFIGMYAGIYLAYIIIKWCVGILYKTFNHEKWYKTLTHDIIKFSVTISQYESIKNNKIFFTKYPNDPKPVFSYRELEKWAERIISKELKKLGGKTK